MNSTQVKELPKRYKISQSAVYSRLYSLKIKPFKDGRKSCLTAEQLQLMDELHAHLEAGGKTGEFVAARIKSDSAAPPPQTKALVTQAQAEAMATSHLQEVTIADEVPIAPENNLQEEIEQLAAEKENMGTAEDLQKVDKRSQYRAASKVIAEASMTMYYEATGNFTIPGLTEQVEQHLQRCDQARSKRTMVNGLNDFLSQRLSRTKPASDNG